MELLWAPNSDKTHWFPMHRIFPTRSSKSLAGPMVAVTGHRGPFWNAFFALEVSGKIVRLDPAPDACELQCNYPKFFTLNVVYQLHWKQLGGGNSNIFHVHQFSLGEDVNVQFDWTAYFSGWVGWFNRLVNPKQQQSASCLAAPPQAFAKDVSELGQQLRVQQVHLQDRLKWPVNLLPPEDSTLPKKGYKKPLVSVRPY